MRWLFVCLLLAGCGDDAMFGGKKDGGEDEGAGGNRPQYFATASTLPTCGEENYEWLVYVADEKVLKVCSVSGWSNVDLTPPVKSAVAYRHDCVAEINDFAYVAKYTAVVMLNGDVFATGSLLAGGFADWGRSEFFPAGHENAAKAPIIFALDAQGEDTGGFWTLALDRDANDFIAAYLDAEIGDQAQVFSFPEGSCAKVAY